MVYTVSKDTFPYKPKFIYMSKSGIKDRHIEFDINGNPIMQGNVNFSDVATISSNSRGSTVTYRSWGDAHPNFSVKRQDQKTFKTEV